MKTLYNILLVLCLFVNSAIAQRTITGKVTFADDGELLPGVSILIKGTTTGTITNIDGYYSITVPNDTTTLVFSFIGMKTQEVTITGTTMDVVLKSDEIVISEVVVTAMGIRRVPRVLGYATSVIESVDISSKRTKKSDRIIIRGSSSLSPDDKKESTPYEPAVVNNLAGTLTAGEVNDFTKWNMWKDISASELNRFRKEWKFDLSKRYVVQMTTENNMPVVNAPVQLIAKDGNVLWNAVTDNTGKAELWINVFDETKIDTKKMSVQAYYDGTKYTLEKVNAFKEGINTIKTATSCSVSGNVDILFTVDATCSMADEIDYLKAELLDIISKIQNKNSNLNMRLGSIFYRDAGDEYLTRKSDFSGDFKTTTDFIHQQSAVGGGDYPEAVDEAMDVAINQMSWNQNTRAKIMFLFLDAPPHGEDSAVITRLQKLTTQAASKGIRIVPVTCSGIQKGTEYLMRAFSLATNGTYLFLTDKSGVGGSHIEPTTDEYTNQLLNNLIISTIENYISVPDCETKLIEITEKTKDTIEVSTAVDKIEATADTLKTTEPVDKITTDVKNETIVSWKYYPNPSDGILNIETNGQIKELYLTDITGKILQKVEISGSETVQLNLEAYPSGIYMLRCAQKDKWLTGKVILRH